MKISDEQIFRFAVAFVALAICALAMSGCSTLGTRDTKQAKKQHEVLVEKKQVAVPVEGATPQVVTLTTTTERWMDEDEVSHSDSSSRSSPDVPAIASAATPVIQAVSGLGLGQVGGGLAALAVTTAMGWLARRGEVKDLKADRDEGWQKHLESQRRAEEYARQLPPS